MSLVDTLMRVGASQFLPMTVHVCDAPSDPKGTSLTTAGIDFSLWARIALSEKQEYVRLAAKHPPAQHIKNIITNRSTSSDVDSGVMWTNGHMLYVKENTSWLEKNRKHSQYLKRKKIQKKNLGVRSQLRPPIRKHG
ncbi:hypothetical protein TcCL_Unassigned01652 [Trypanosoma cruzi]|nr:hypothetical protein TcCL_Unassigned01652 [Trypanosoma cruzi]